MKIFAVPRGDLVGRGSMLSIGGGAGSKKNDSSGGGVSYTSGGYLPVDTRYSGYRISCLSPFDKYRML